MVPASVRPVFAALGLCATALVAFSAPKGDAAKGRTAWEGRCANCHHVADQDVRRDRVFTALVATST